MNQPLYPDSVYAYRQKYRSVRFFSAFLSVLGGLTLTLLLCRCVSLRLDAWSPTATAQSCFHFPDSRILPDREAVTQSLLSAAFFGSDALYFDGGEENTGIDESLPPAPSDGAQGGLPEQPLMPELPKQLPDGMLPDGRNIYAYDRQGLPSGELALLPYNLNGGASSGDVLLSNTTAYKPDVAALLAREYPIPVNLSEYSAETFDILTIFLISAVIS